MQLTILCSQELTRKLCGTHAGILPRKSQGVLGLLMASSLISCLLCMLGHSCASELNDEMLQEGTALRFIQKREPSAYHRVLPAI